MADAQKIAPRAKVELRFTGWGGHSDEPKTFEVPLNVALEAREPGKLGTLLRRQRLGKGTGRLSVDYQNGIKAHYAFSIDTTGNVENVVVI